VDDLGPVPDLLRAILEETLSQEASPQSLDRFLPKIRDIIIGLLHGLKRKQSRLRAARSKDGVASSSDSERPPEPPQRQQTADFSRQDDPEPDRGLEARPQHRSSVRSVERTQSGSRPADEPGLPNRPPSGPGARPSTPQDENQRTIQESLGRSSLKDRRATPSADPESSSEASSSQQSLPIVQAEDFNGPIQRISLHGDTPPPRPPPKQDALAALQRGGDLERRASRRYSAYQISKHLGASPGGVPMIPPQQNSPIPNRGRDVRESLNAVRKRSSLVPAQPRPQATKDTSPGRSPAILKTPEGNKSSLRNPASGADQPAANLSGATASSTNVELPGESKPDERPTMSGTVNGPVDAFDYQAAPANQPSAAPEPKQSRSSPSGAAAQTPAANANGQTPFVPEQSPQPGKELTLFLQYRHRIKKVILSEGSNELSVARLQLAFIEKFAWNTHNNGVDLPEIYIQDSVSGVRHELDDLTDIKDRSVLVLNVEPLDEVKRHIDDNFGGLRKLMETVKTSLDGQQLAINQVSDRQQDSAKDIARLASAPTTTRNNSLQMNGSIRSPVVTDSAVRDVQTLRRDLAIMRQSLSSFSTSVQSSMAAIRTKADAVKAKAVDVSIPVFDVDSGSGRSYVTKGKKSLSDDSDTLVNRVDDLQDLVEDLRKDVVTRGVRPLPRQLESANKDISEAIKELKKMQDYVKREKPTWTKIWEKELEVVCNDREFLTMQEDLIADLDDDLEKATQTMHLVEQATKQQNLQSTTSGNPPVLRHVPNIDTEVDPHTAKTGVLGQVRALQPNHESRLEAIERAEKARIRELASRHRDAAFTRELGSFVEDGKLKKSGGVDEADRLRRQKDERAMRDEFDEQQKRKAERVKARAEERARLAAAAQSSSPQEETSAQGDEPTDEVGPEAGDGSDETSPKREEEHSSPGELLARF
jgi:Actin interacting protein 3